MIRSILLPLLGTLATPSLADSAAPPSYRLDPASSDLYVVVRNDTSAAASGLGHDHVVYASDFAGTVTWPTEPGGACSVDIRVPVRSLVVDPPGLRDRADLDDRTISEDAKEKMSRNMWGTRQLAADSFPAVTFRADHCAGGTGRVRVEGTLTVRESSRPVAVDLEVRADGDAFSASGTFDTTHTAFGFEPFSATPFGPRNQDRLTFVLAVRGAAG